jgi:hypothetical protein
MDYQRVQVADLSACLGQERQRSRSAAVRRDQHAEALCDQYQPSERLDLALLHDLLSVRFDSPFGSPQLMSNLLVELAANHQGEDLALARGEA